jgi:2-phospho-L-lactate transferase/gluconeogenesis factor (CofD/UPF0052 family)
MTIEEWLAVPLEKDTIREMRVVHRGGDQSVAVMLDECWVKYYHDPTTKTVFEAEAKTLKHAISKIERKLARFKG